MRLLILAGCALALSGCGTLGGGNKIDVETLKLLSEHVSGCERDYQGSLGLGANFTFKFHCEPQAKPAPEAPAE